MKKTNKFSSPASPCRPPVMDAVQMKRCLLHVTGTGEIVFLPHGRIFPFDEARAWIGWMPDLRVAFDAWFADPDRQQVEALKPPVLGRFTSEFAPLAVKL